MSSKTLTGLILTAMVLSLLPFALIAKSRATRSERTAPHLVLDMDNQPRFNPQAENKLFADGRAMRPQIEGTVAKEDLTLAHEVLTVLGDSPRRIAGDSSLAKITSPEQYAALVYGRVRAPGTTDEAFNAVQPPKDTPASQTFYVNAFPEGIKITDDFLKRGQERFNIYCAPCHGQTGYGDGMIQRRVDRLKETNADATAAWVQPSNLNDAERRNRPLGHVFNTITNGIRNMPAYDKQISIADRWAIVAYVKALQQSQGATAQK